MQYTTYYSLSQIEATDKPTWLVMYNADMAAIDAGIHAAQADATAAGTLANTADGKADANALDIVDIKADIVNLQTAVGTATGNINTINSLIGDGTALLTGQTIISGLNSTDESIAPVENSATVGASYAIGDQFIRGGVLYEALSAITAGTAFSALSVGTDYKISDDLTSQIQTLTNEVALKTGVVFSEENDIITVTGDGVKTFTDLLKELAGAAQDVLDALGVGEYVQFLRLDGTAIGSGEYSQNTMFVGSGATFDILFTTMNYDAINAWTQFRQTRVINSADAFGRSLRIADDGTITTATYTSVIASGNTIRLHYNKLKTI